MLMARKLYPLGIQTFERIRKEDKLYIDKTEYIYHMTHTSGNMTTIMPLLYQSDYITIKDYNQKYNYYILDIPNKEVKDVIHHFYFAHRRLSRCGGTYPKRQS